MNEQNTSRRRFLAATAGAVTFGWRPQRSRADAGDHEIVRLGLVADVHKDVMHDADQRLATFVERMNTWRPDFAAQLGDFCQPIPSNQAFLNVWRKLQVPGYHVLGNHDMDGDAKRMAEEGYGVPREQTIAFCGMEKRYYSFDVKGLHFVVLDGNDRGPDQRPYFRYIAEDQAQWLADDLAATRRPTFLFIHQSLERESGVANQAEIRRILEKANNSAGLQKVVACFSGHHHRDYVRRIDGIYYPQINSMSYYWLGSQMQHVRYSEQINREHPYIKYTVPYRDPLYAMVTIDPGRGQMTIEGIRSEFVGPSPWELGADRKKLEGESLVPAISDRKLLFN